MYPRRPRIAALSLFAGCDRLFDDNELGGPCDNVMQQYEFVERPSTAPGPRPHQMLEEVDKQQQIVHCGVRRSHEVMVNFPFPLLTSLEYSYAMVPLTPWIWCIPPLNSAGNLTSSVGNETVLAEREIGLVEDVDYGVVPRVAAATEWCPTPSCYMA